MSGGGRGALLLVVLVVPEAARAAQEKVTSLHRKYVWSMCEACQMV